MTTIRLTRPQKRAEVVCTRWIAVACRVSCCVFLLIANTALKAQSAVADDGAGVDNNQSNVFERWRSAIANDRASELLSLWQGSSDKPALLEARTGNGKDAFMIAAKTGHTDLFDLLLEAGADPDSSTVTGGTPIMFAALGNHPELVKRLIAAGADPNRQGSNGWSALTIAAAKGFPDLIRLLVSVGARPDVLDVYRWSPLMRAVDNGHTDAVTAILAVGDVDVEQQDEAGNTALHYAVAHGNAIMVTALLEAGADPDVLNRDRLSPRQLAFTGSASESLSPLFER